MPQISRKEKKEKRWDSLQQALCNYSKCLFVEVDNVSSKQILEIRKELRKIDAKMVMGKNTLMRASIKELQAKPEESDKNYAKRIERWEDRPHLSIILDQLKSNTGMIFTNNDIYAIKDVLDNNTRGAKAQVGKIAPDTVIIPPGSSGLDPNQTSFFQALSIQTKIMRGKIEIINPVTVVKQGDKINQSQAALLDKLHIRPFEYKMTIKNYIENGQLIDGKVLSISPGSLLEKFTKNAKNITALSLASGYTIPSAAPHLVLNAFKKLAAVGLAVDYEFEQLNVMKTAAAEPVKDVKESVKRVDIAEEKTEEANEEEIEILDIFNDDEY